MSQSSSASTPPGFRHTPPWLFGILVLPFSAAIGWLSLGVPYLLHAHGASLATIGVISATASMPHAVKFFWSPLIDLGRRKLWYVCASIACAVLLGLVALVPDPANHLELLTIALTGSQAAAATLASALDALMATTTHPSKQGRASGFYAAGNTGGTSLFGAGAVWMISNLSPILAGLSSAAVVLLCCAWVFRITELPHAAAAKVASVWKKIGGHATNIGKDLWSLLKSREGITGMIICAAPVGCGALTNLFTGMSGTFHASEHVVELTGMAAAGASFLGSLLGGPLADRMNRRLAYVLAGGLTALCGLAMAIAPSTSTTYVWGVLTYSFANAIAFTAFYALVLEIVAHGAAVTTKYTLFVSISNLAINYATALDGWAPGLGHFEHTHATVLFDTLLTFAGISVVGLMVVIARAFPPKAQPAPAVAIAE